MKPTTCPTLLVLAMFVISAFAAAGAPESDLIIRHGRVVDGTGNPAYFADVAVKNGRIAAVGKVTGGLSTGLVYPPGPSTKTEEIIELAKVTAAYDGIYVSHIRNEGREVLNALNELFHICGAATKTDTPSTPASLP